MIKTVFVLVILRFLTSTLFHSIDFSANQKVDLQHDVLSTFKCDNNSMNCQKKASNFTKSATSKYVMNQFIILAEASPVKEPGGLREKGETEYLKLVEMSKSGDSTKDQSCWASALNFFHSITESCDVLQDHIRSIVALTMTKCHYSMRPNGFPNPADGCNPSDKSFLNCKSMDCAERNIRIITSCKEQMSESTFISFLGFLNHFDNICFYMQSSIWQQKTDVTIGRLSSTANEVIDLLDSAAIQNRMMQNNLLEGSKALQSNVEEVFGEMKEEVIRERMKMREDVEEERQKMKGTFDEFFALFYKVIDLQRNTAAKLNQFSTVLVYISLVILTYYMTVSDSTKHSRVPLCFVWTIMLFGEVGMYRLFTASKVSRFTNIMDALDQPFGFSEKLSLFLHLAAQRIIWSVSQLDEHTLHTILSFWRWSCIALGITIWIRTWWNWRDPYKQLHEMIFTELQGLKFFIKEFVGAELQARIPLPDGYDSHHLKTLKDVPRHSVEDSIAAAISEMWQHWINKDKYNNDSDTEDSDYSESESTDHECIGEKPEYVHTPERCHNPIIGRRSSPYAIETTAGDYRSPSRYVEDRFAVQRLLSFCSNSAARQYPSLMQKDSLSDDQKMLSTGELDLKNVNHKSVKNKSINHRYSGMTRDLVDDCRTAPITRSRSRKEASDLAEQIFERSRKSQDSYLKQMGNVTPQIDSLMASGDRYSTCQVPSSSFSRDMDIGMTADSGNVKQYKRKSTAKSASRTKAK